MKSPVFFDKYYSQYNIIKLIFNILKPIKSFLFLSVLLVLLTSINDYEPFKVKIIGTLDRARLTTGDSLISEQIYHRLMFPPEFWQNKASGEVEISFDVKKDSTIENITIEKDLFNGCNKYLSFYLKGLKWGRVDNEHGNHIKLQFSLNYKDFDIKKFSNLNPELKDSTTSLNNWSNQMHKIRAVNIKEKGLVVGMILTDTNGNIIERKIVFGLTPETDSIVASILNEIPPLTPGIAHGEKVNSGKFFEFYFNLNINEASTAVKEFHETEIYKTYQGLPVFNEDEKVLKSYLNKVHYPEIAIENNIQGTVVISLFIDENGKKLFQYINNKTNKLLAEASYFHIKNMPDWEKGGMIFNIPQRSIMNIPIKFKLQ